MKNQPLSSFESSAEELHLTAHVLRVDSAVLVVDENDGSGGVARAVELGGVDLVSAILQLLGQHAGQLGGGGWVARAFDGEHAGGAVPVQMLQIINVGRGGAVYMKCVASADAT